MRISQICCLVLMCSSLCGWAQEQDSVEVKPLKFAIYPAVGYSPETKFSFGTVAFFVFNKPSSKHGFHRPSSITPYIIFTTNKQVTIKSDFDLFFNNGMNLNMQARIFDFPDNYYGIGNETDPEMSEVYTDKYIQLAGSLFKPINPKIFAGLLFDFQYNKIEGIVDSGLLASDAPVGVAGGFNMGVGPGMRYDTRNSTLWPTHGRLINAGITLFGKAFGGEYNYTNFVVDYRQYMKLFGPKSVLAFQVKMDMSSGDDIPFYKLNKIGGGGRLRGFEHRNLYRDRQAVYVQVEARQELFWRFGGVLFVGAGEVFHSFSDFQAEDIRLVYGLGGRFRAMKDEKLNFRMDVGFTDNGQYAFYLSVREAF
ncbi:BamA/TamA family outer membrane protein [Reichenbachiella carrageenanivorans]|uniref:BamA/TamA family outer membrane protein n=1 Tax=Reichenbachiella carrageenanivorans TaxID=2979869 RepID=A0ABY6D0I1_9BACT|nr:BamA/TamA family outer membrane protein [Reichenbachiella carrageenanivorans]UXX79679.1 BamA/TamA family outer membrane protein [Reichenbachiella carrageenanivorans]